MPTLISLMNLNKHPMKYIYGKSQDHNLSLTGATKSSV